MNIFRPAQHSSFGLSPEFLKDMRRSCRRHRRLLVGLIGALILLGFTHALVPFVSPGTPVLVAARSLGSGDEVSPGDVALVHIPHSAVPEGAFSSLDDLPSSSLHITVPKGTPLAPGFFSHTRVDVPEGKALTSVTLPDASLSSLASEGARLRLSCAMSTDKSLGGEVRSIEAIARPRSDKPAQQSPAATFTGPSPTTLIVEVRTDEIADVVHCTETGKLNIAIID